MQRGRIADLRLPAPLAALSGSEASYAWASTWAGRQTALQNGKKRTRTSKAEGHATSAGCTAVDAKCRQGHLSLVISKTSKHAPSQDWLGICGTLLPCQAAACVGSAEVPSSWSPGTRVWFARRLAEKMLQGSPRKALARDTPRRKHLQCWTHRLVLH